MKRIILAILCLALVPLSAYAQAEPKPRKPLLELNGPCNPLGDSRPQCQAQGSPAPLGQQPAAASTAPAGNCQFGTFALITPQNLVQTIQNCGETFLTDSQAALASAKTANDSVAIGCLTPGTALIQAGVGTPGTPGDATASPPIPAVPAKLGGPVLLFQKYREFVNAGGISACEAWVNTVIAATVGAAAGAGGAVAGGVAGAALLAPIK
jgi:hypothetical protein